jgi:hypothetical protein
MSIASGLSFVFGYFNSTVVNGKVLLLFFYGRQGEWFQCHSIFFSVFAWKLSARWTPNFTFNNG